MTSVPTVEFPHMMVLGHLVRAHDGEERGVGKLEIRIIITSLAPGLVGSLRRSSTSRTDQGNLGPSSAKNAGIPVLG